MTKLWIDIMDAAKSKACCLENCHEVTKQKATHVAMSKEHIVLEVMPSNWFRARSTNSRRISMLLRCRSVFWCLDYIWLHGKHQSHLAKKGMKGDTNSSQNCCRRVSWCFLLNWNCAKLMFLWLLCVVFFMLLAHWSTAWSWGTGTKKLWSLMRPALWCRKNPKRRLSDFVRRKRSGSNSKQNSVAVQMITCHFKLSSIRILSLFC